MIFDSSGSLANVSRHDYLPFGEELYAGGRTSNNGYTNSDGSRQKFTGYESDSESQLNFAQARYQSAVQGRFSGVDRIIEPYHPQNLNGYSYVGNNPLNFVDPSGLFSEYDFQEGQGQEPRVTQADIGNPANFTEVIRIYTNVWQSTGRPLTPLELLVSRPLSAWNSDRLSAQAGIRNVLDPIVLGPATSDYLNQMSSEGNRHTSVVGSYKWVMAGDMIDHRTGQEFLVLGVTGGVPAGSFSITNWKGPVTPGLHASVTGSVGVLPGINASANVFHFRDTFDVEPTLASPQLNGAVYVVLPINPNPCRCYPQTIEGMWNQRYNPGPGGIR